MYRAMIGLGIYINSDLQTGCMFLFLLGQFILYYCNYAPILIHSNAICGTPAPVHIISIKKKYLTGFKTTLITVKNFTHQFRNLFLLNRKKVELLKLFRKRIKSFIRSF